MRTLLVAQLVRLLSGLFRDVVILSVVRLVRRYREHVTANAVRFFEVVRQCMDGLDLHKLISSSQVAYKGYDGSLGFL